MYYKKYKKYKNKVRSLQLAGGKKKAKYRSDNKLDPFHNLVGLFLSIGFVDTVAGQECGWDKKTSQQKYNFIKRAFNTQILPEHISSTSERPMLVLNIVDYQPLPGLPPSGHTLMFLRLDDGNYGTIGFYPKDYASSFGLLASLFGGKNGLLATPDPIARKSIRKTENLEHISVVYDGYLDQNQTGKISK